MVILSIKLAHVTCEKHNRDPQVPDNHAPQLGSLTQNEEQQILANLPNNNLRFSVRRDGWTKPTPDK